MRNVLQLLIAILRSRHCLNVDRISHIFWHIGTHQILYMPMSFSPPFLTSIILFLIKQTTTKNHIVNSLKRRLQWQVFGCRFQGGGDGGKDKCCCFVVTTRCPLGAGQVWGSRGPPREMCRTLRLEWCLIQGSGGGIWMDLVICPVHGAPGVGWRTLLL